MLTLERPPQISMKIFHLNAATYNRIILALIGKELVSANKGVYLASNLLSGWVLTTFEMICYMLLYNLLCEQQKQPLEGDSLLVVRLPLLPKKPVLFITHTSSFFWEVYHNNIT